MKNLIVITLLISLCLLTACDKIHPPYTEECHQTAQKTVLIEKFTGHKCSNCPEATRKIDELKECYGDNLISISIHPGDLTEFTGTDSNYPYDFSTKSSDTIANDMGAVFLPLGTINRIDGGISNRCFTTDEWANQIDNLLFNENGEPLEKNINIEINTVLNHANKELNIETSISILNDLPENYNLCLLIIENKIISPQIDNTQFIADYEHNHIYRYAINGTYGESIIGLNFTHTMIFDTNANINWTNNWNNLNNCYVVGYVYNTESLVVEESTLKRVVHE